jgi:opacity protein-like surface antigen
MAGAELSLTDQLSADIGYRYRQILSGDDPSDHQVLVGLRFKF